METEIKWEGKNYGKSAKKQELKISVSIFTRLRGTVTVEYDILSSISTINPYITTHFCFTLHLKTAVLC